MIQSKRSATEQAAEEAQHEATLKGAEGSAAKQSEKERIEADRNDAIVQRNQAKESTANNAHKSTCVPNGIEPSVYMYVSTNVPMLTLRERQ